MLGGTSQNSGRSGALSGFPEWLPDQRIAELAVLDTARRIFELHGFASLETRAVEPLEQMLRKGEIDKEVYILRRMQAPAEEPDAGLGLHFDLTVPLARYVVAHAGKLEFPFRRYQIQKVWRGERPQEGRFREFTQADIDIVGRDILAFHHEVEVALVMSELFAALPCPPTVIRVNNRKLAEGFYRGVGAADPAAVLREIDKLAKVGPRRVAESLQLQLGLSARDAQRCLDLAAIRTTDTSFVATVRALGVRNDLLDEGLQLLAEVVSGANSRVPGAVVADLSIARGLDYYTGTVYETDLVGYESFGSVCSGGRYDALARDRRNTYPGVGISLGVTRLMSILLGRDLLRVSRSVPTAVLVALADESHRSVSEAVAGALRARGIPTEVAPRADKYGKQIRYADRRGIPYVWFPADPSAAPDSDSGPGVPPDGGASSDAGMDSVKDLTSGEQKPANADTWSPDPDRLRPEVRLVDPPANHQVEPTN